MIKYQREQIMHMTQEQFSIYTNTTIRTVQKWESGECTPSVNNLKKIFSENSDRLERAYCLRIELLSQNKKIKVKKNAKQSGNKEIKDKKYKIHSLNKYHKECENTPYKLYGEGFKFPCGKKLYCSNTVILGSAGSGKTLNYIQPNLYASEYSNFVITTTSVDYLLHPINHSDVSVANNPLDDYDIKIINTKNLTESAQCNPFLYFQNHKDIFDFVNTLVEGISSEESEYYIAYEKNILYHAFLLVRYLYCNKLGYNYPAQNYNITSVLKLLHNRLENENAFDDAIETIIKRGIVEDNIISFLYHENKKITSISKELFSSILLTLLTDLEVITEPSFTNIIENDNVNIYEIFESDKKAIIFNINEYDMKYHFFSSCIIELILNMSNRYCAAQHIKFIIDEAAFIKIRGLYEYLSTNRGCSYSIDLIYQNIEQIRILYPLQWQTIINKANLVFMGARDDKTVEYVYDKLKYSSKFKYTRSKLDIQDILTLPNDYWIVITKGDKPIIIRRNFNIYDKLQGINPPMEENKNN